MRSWALEIISEKASEYLERLNTKIQRISLSEKTRDVNISCYSRNTTLDIESLSGGEQVSVALALRLGMSHLLGASNLNFMILDEPTAHLDLHHTLQIFRVLKKLVTETSKTILISTHEVNLAIKFSDEIALMNENSFYKDTSDKLIENNLFDSLFLDEMIHFDKNLRQFIIK